MYIPSERPATRKEHTSSSPHAALAAFLALVQVFSLFAAKIPAVRLWRSRSGRLYHPLIQLFKDQRRFYSSLFDKIFPSTRSISPICAFSRIPEAFLNFLKLQRAHLSLLIGIINVEN